MSFNEYYNKIYLPLHSKTGTKLLHLSGVLFTLNWFILFLLLTIGDFSLFHLLMLLLTPFVIYPFAWTSHFFIEKNKPAAWENPILAKLSDFRMCWEIMTGKIKLF